MPPMPRPAPNPFDVTYCPRCRNALPPGQTACARCAEQTVSTQPLDAQPVDPQPDVQPLDPKPVRRWRALDVAMVAAMLLYVVLDGAQTLTYASFLGLLEFLATAAAYGLVAVDVWSDENSFGVYAYLVAGWHLFWTVTGLIMDRERPLTGLHAYGFVMLALDLLIVAGLWGRYGSPLEQRLY